MSDSGRQIGDCGHGKSRSQCFECRIADLERRVAAMMTTRDEKAMLDGLLKKHGIDVEPTAERLPSEQRDAWKCPTCGEGMYSAIPGLIRCMKCNPQSPARIEHNLCSSCGQPAGAGREANCSNEFHAPQKDASGLMALVARWRHLAKVYDDGRAKQYLECAAELEVALRTTSEQPK